jgi:hypothetical protein
MNYSAVVIGKQIRDIIHTSHADSLALVQCSFGSLATLPAPPLEPAIPAVFVTVRDVPSRELTVASDHNYIEVKYVYDILYLRPIAANEESYAEGIEDAEAIATTLMEDRKLSNLTLTESKINNSMVGRINYDEGTTRFFNDVLKLRCDVIVITFTVDVKAQR